MLWLYLLNLVFSVNEIAFQNISYKFWWIICNFFGQSLLSTSTWNLLKHFILFNILSWSMFVSSCVYCSKLVSFNITFAVNKLLFESLEISCISGTIILSTSSGTRCSWYATQAFMQYIVDFHFIQNMLRRSSQRLVLTWRYKEIKRDKNENYAQIYNMKKYIKIGNKR